MLNGKDDIELRMMVFDNVHFDIVSNPRSYYTTDNTITLNNPDPYSHVIFNGWTSSDITTPTTSMTIPTGSTGDKTFTANWEVNS